MESQLGERKFFLDWLRIFAFLLLILFHVGMVYVSWDYNLKSQHIFPDLELAMNSLSSWRLVLLFFISGVASRYLLEKLSAVGFAKDRTRRLLPVILLGMVVINPSQVYVELVSEGHVDSSYLDFWLTSYLLAEPYPDRIVPTWDHLWFLVYLLVYALGLSLVFRLLKPGKPRVLAVPWLIVVPAAWLSVSNVLVTDISPVTQAFFDDWANHLRWIGVYGTGVVCAAQTHFWETLRMQRRKLLAASMVLFATQLANGIYYRTGLADPFWDGVTYGVSGGVYGWCVVLTLCGFAAEYLNRPSKLLSYLTDAVLPIYVFHQPVLLICAFFVFPLALPVLAEVTILIVVTGIGSVAGYEIFARRTRPLRFLFGLKPATV